MLRAKAEFFHVGIVQNHTLPASLRLLFVRTRRDNSIPVYPNVFGCVLGSVFSLFFSSLHSESVGRRDVVGSGEWIHEFDNSMIAWNKDVRKEFLSSFPAATEQLEPQVMVWPPFGHQ